MKRSIYITLILGSLLLFIAAPTLQPFAQESSEETSSESAKGLGSILADTVKGMFSVISPNGKSAQPVDGSDEGEPEKFSLNFNNAPIEQVLKFISDLSKKVVLKSDDVQGQINIINPNEVTAVQAMEIIDQAFLLKGITFIEYDEMIIVMTVSGAKQKGLEVKSGADDDTMGSRMKHQVIKLNFASPSSLKESLSPLIPDTANVIADERTRSLIITDTAANIQRLEDIIRELDKESAIGDMSVQVFRLKYLNANDIGRDLDDLLGNIVQAQLIEGRGGRRQQAPVEVVIDRQTNSLIVSAPTEAIDAVKEFITKLDTSKTEELHTQTFTLKNGDATEIVQTLTQLAQGRQTSNYRPGVSADSRTNTIVVSAYPEDVLEVGKLIQVLDSKESYEKLTKIFRLESADAIILKPMLDQLLNQEDSNSNSRYRWYSSGNDQKDTSIIEDQRQNALVITAKPGDFPMIEALVEQLDQPLPESAEEPRVYPVKHVRASDLAYLIEALFEEESSNSNYFYFGNDQSSGITGLTGKVKIIADPNTNSLIVIAATPRAFDIVERLVEKLDRLAPEFGGTKVIQLKNADAAELSQQLTQLFQEDQSNQGNRGFYWYLNQSSQGGEQEVSNLIGNVRIVSETRTNSLLVTTNSQYFDLVEDIIKELDREISQVLVEILIIEIVDLKNNELGINWPDNVPIQADLDLNQSFNQFSLDRSTVISRSSFETVLGFLAKSDKTNVLARPDVLTGDNQSAYVEVVDRIPTLGSISQGNAGNLQSTLYNDVGLVLTVQPHINDEDTVTINVDLETGKVLNQFQLRVGDSEIPAFNRRRVRTELMINDEETAVLSGVIDTSFSDIEDGVPGLRHIPILGYLFKSKKKQQTNKELMAFITPYILNTAEDRDRVFLRHRERINVYDSFQNQMKELNVRIGRPE
ncbi:MAG: secretin N-terminal domain-containing protein [Candidatus Hinthialibacter antarcticus]|nr:secretin N-terminal domain-containing protein [Candidatus Hinthialibacter antarcticus]